MSWGAVAVGGATLASGVMGAQAAGAAGAAAGAQNAAAIARAKEATDYSKDLEKRVNSASDMSPQELQAYESSLAAAQKTVDSDMKMLDAIDPALMEASTQALSLLRGQDASSLAPIRNQRAQQRSQLLRTLREQLGPGAETSSAGIKALNQFDTETSTMMANAQQSMLGGLLGTAQQQRAQGANGIATLTSVGGMFGNATQRKAGNMLAAGQNTTNAILGTGQGVVDSAGAGYVGQQAQAQGLASMFGNLANTGMTMYGSGMFGGGNTPAPVGGVSATPFTYSSPTFGQIGQ